MNTENTKSKNLVSQISEAIRFHEWIKRLDQNDQKLDPAKRKKKWMIILVASFLIYLISFFVFPKPAITYEPIQPVSEGNPDTAKTLKHKKSLSFEMPVDSFENALKQEIHEKLPEKK
ncbi:hypothetical protein AQPE_0444 [Aquipluma nitroreducens]|uniref:Uncharacterized protein n=1 Tax=Aquipluma nitroreducens TaxID=2010828 RepID=A0A5K7S481_9BACT|nr:hypothetical protein [Aquipluma nitroreducens]BBE16307.1 hypothetical protein AQPE_0444 [Aquipluma nitroreducens]